MIVSIEQIAELLANHGIKIAMVTEPEEKHNQKIICKTSRLEPMRSLRERIAAILFANGYYNFSIKSTYLFHKTDDNVPKEKKATCEIIFWSKIIKKEKL